MAPSCSGPGLLHLQADFLETQSGLVQSLATEIHKAASILTCSTYGLEAEATCLRKRAWEMRSAEMEMKCGGVKESKDQKNTADLEMKELTTTAVETMEVAEQAKIRLKNLIDIVCRPGSGTGTRDGAGAGVGVGFSSGSVFTKGTSMTISADTKREPSLKEVQEHKLDDDDTDEDCDDGEDGNDTDTCRTQLQEQEQEQEHAQAQPQFSTTVSARPPTSSKLARPRHPHRQYSTFVPVNTRVRVQTRSIPPHRQLVRGGSVGVSKNVIHRRTAGLSNKVRSAAAERWLETKTKIQTVSDECLAALPGGICLENMVPTPANMAKTGMSPEVPAMCLCGPDGGGGAVGPASASESDLESEVGSKHEPEPEHEHGHEPEPEHGHESRYQAEPSSHNHPISEVETGHVARAEAGAEINHDFTTVNKFEVEAEDEAEDEAEAEVNSEVGDRNGNEPEHGIGHGDRYADEYGDKHQHEHEHEHAYEHEAEDDYLSWIPSKVTIPRRQVHSAAEGLLQAMMISDQVRMERERAY